MLIFNGANNLGSKGVIGRFITLGCKMFVLCQKVLSRFAQSKFQPNLVSPETFIGFHGNEAFFLNIHFELHLSVKQKSL